MTPCIAPAVLAGVTTRNRAHILPRALDSLQAVAYDGLQVVVIDDASTDATPALAARYPGFAWRRRESPRGYMENRNELMRESAAKYFLSLDDDAWFVRGDELRLAVDHLEAHPDVAAVAFDILSPDRPTAADRAAARPVSLFIGCGHLLRLDAARAPGLYAPTPGAYGSEEKDLCLRLADRGLRVVLLPGVHVWHEKAWADRDNRPLHRSGVCNDLVMTVRRCPAPALPPVLAAKFLSYAWFWLRRPFYARAGLAGLGDALGNFGASWRTRGPVRAATYWRFIRGLPPRSR
jgi:glycosyltransferase involved in cell wall biosynthesis